MTVSRCPAPRPSPYLGRSGSEVLSRPIGKGTAVTADGLLDKDRAENVMIVDLVRNDLGVIAAPGPVEVPEFLVVEAHPGLCPRPGPPVSALGCARERAGRRCSRRHFLRAV